MRVGRNFGALYVFFIDLTFSCFESFLLIDHKFFYSFFALESCKKRRWRDYSGEHLSHLQQNSSQHAPLQHIRDHCLLTRLVNLLFKVLFFPKLMYCCFTIFSSKVCLKLSKTVKHAQLTILLNQNFVVCNFNICNIFAMFYIKL